MNSKVTIEFAVSVGERMLANGCGTHRIEGLMDKILSPCGFNDYEIFVSTTGIVVTVDSPVSGVTTMVKKVPKKKMHTEHISLIEDVVNSYENNEITAEDAIIEINHIEEKSTYPFWLSVAAYGIAGSFRTMMFGGRPIDGLASIITGIFMGLVVKTLLSKNTFTFLVNCCGGFVAGFIATLLIKAGLGTMIDKIIIGTLMPIAPGVPFVHSVNDILHGDYASGIVRAYEAILTGAAIGTGVAFSMFIWDIFGGGITL